MKIDSRQIFSLCLMIAASISMAFATEVKEKERLFFNYSRTCDYYAKKDSWSDGYKFWCIFGYTSSLMTDLAMIPSIATGNSDATSDNTTEKTAASSAATSGKKALEAKEYKKSLLYAVADDAVYFTAVEGREPSTALRKAMDLISPDFPGAKDQELAGHIIRAHMNAMKFYAGLE